MTNSAQSAATADGDWPPGAARSAALPPDPSLESAHGEHDATAGAPAFTDGQGSSLNSPDQQRRVELWSVFLRAVRALADTRTVAEVHAAIQPLAAPIFQSRDAWLITRPTAGGDWPVWSAHGRDGPLAGPLAPLCTLPEALMNQVSARLDADFQVLDADTADGALGAIARRGHFASIIGHVLRSSDQSLGVLIVGWSGHDAGRPEHGFWMALVAAEVEAALARTRHASGSVPSQRPDHSSLEMLGTIASGAAHGLNNAIGGIVASLELASAPASAERADHHVAVARRLAGSAREIVRRVQVATGTAEPLERVPVDLDDIVAGAIATLQAEAAGRGRRLRIRTVLQAGVSVAAVPDQLDEAITNLLTNAVEAAADAGSIAITTRAVGARAFVEISDTGPGIPSAIRADLFRPFVSTKSGSGRGLGLAIAKAIVESLGGSISIDSAPGAGTRVGLEIPAFTASGVAGPDMDQASGRSRAVHILLVEDDVALREATLELLAQDGHAVIAVVDASQARKAFVPGRFDLVIADLGLPAVSGWDLLAELRAREPELPLMIVTGYGPQPDPARQRELNITTVLAKPYSGAELGAAVARAIA